MADKITLNNIGSLTQNPTSAQTLINANNTIIQTAFDNTLSRDGTSPNQMGSSLDMNSNSVINLPAPVNPNDAARLADIGNAPAYANQAAASATAAAGSASAASTSATASANSATASANSATQAQNYVQGLSGTSTTSNTIGTGSKTFTATTGNLWTAGQFLTISSTANSANYMHGSVTSYNSTTGALVVNVLDIGGAGTLASWNINVSGTQGSQGPTGPSGAVGVTGTPTATQIATFTNSTTIKGSSPTIDGSGNISTTAQVVAGSMAIVGSATQPHYSVQDTSQGTDNKIWDHTADGGILHFRAISDNYGAGSDWLQVSRSGYNPTKATIPITTATTSSSTGALTVAGGVGIAGSLNVGSAIVGGSVAAASYTDSNGNIYSNIPQNSQSAAYTLVLGDAQKHIYHPSADTTARTFTIPANSSVAYPVGTAITFINDTSAGVVTIAITTDTLVLAGSGSTGSRTLAANGVATAIKITSTRWIISGAGIS